MTQNFRISESFKESGSERAVKSEMKSEEERSKIAVLHHPPLQTPNADRLYLYLYNVQRPTVPLYVLLINVHPRTGPGDT